jgi:asparagine synthase (glutamine-hydrolysing)
MSWEQAVEGTRQALIQAVKLRLRADVPLAFCMSGGIDSNALISIAKNVFHYDVHGFTIVNTDERYAEWDLVELAVREQKLRHTAIPIRTQGFLPGLRELVRYHDAPVYTITYYAHWLLMESIARHGYRISVSGTGADELFTGYYDHHNAYLYEVRHDPELFAQSLANWRRHIGRIVRNPLLQNPCCFIDNPEQREHIYLNNHRFASFLRGDYQPEPFREEPYARGLLRRRMLNELFHESVPVILHEDDLNAMYYSIENRSPYLDRHLMEFAYRIPTRHLIRQGRAKAVLREAMRGIVPDPILDNPRKVGFNAPIFDFLDVRDPQVRAYLLDDSPIYRHLRRESIQALLDKPSLPNSESKFLFYFLGCKMFLEEFGP